MPVATQLEILDLRHFSARQLRPLLEAEAAVWEDRLRWNYRGSTELLLQYLDSRILPGFVALDRGRVCGFTFCVYEGHKAVIGDAYAIGSDPIRTTNTLPYLLLYDTGIIDDIFLQAGFTMSPRLFMEYNFPSPETNILGLNGGHIPTFDPPNNIELARWSTASYQAAAGPTHEASTRTI